ncbi:hypothetical protein OUZ56_009253 [Daphnia magna]|uniref:Uncharacterized protein n=1 Tax=Daphnia magna TaxID=35525 RepID=A0ABR0AFH5_9CRUS|nr:hypothetical protein OUZ56_009253 [Daphnia magna]
MTEGLHKAAWEPAQRREEAALSITAAACGTVNGRGEDRRLAALARVFRPLQQNIVPKWLCVRMASRFSPPEKLVDL